MEKKKEIFEEDLNELEDSFTVGAGSRGMKEKSASSSSSFTKKSDRRSVDRKKDENVDFEEDL